MTLIKCTQQKCTFNEANGGQMGCPECSECNAESNIVEDDTCVNCHNCLNDEGYVRSGISKFLKDKIELLEKKQEELEISIINKSER